MNLILMLCGAAALVLAAFGVIAGLLIQFRDPFWRYRHHDHLIPPAPRSPRAAA